MQLTLEGCRTRQQRFCHLMMGQGLACSILSDPRHVLYFTGFKTPAGQSSAVVVDESGGVHLIADCNEPPPSADQTTRVEASVLATSRIDHSRRVADTVLNVTSSKKGPAGLDRTGASGVLGSAFHDAFDVSSMLSRVRRKKEPDELDLIRSAVSVLEACYGRAREILRPGISELDVYAELYYTAVKTAGEKLPAIGNDFQCGSIGGPPRNRRATDGELYILDLGVCIGGYNADLSRTFLIGPSPSPAQRTAWSRVVEALEYVKSTARPGYSCRRIYEEARLILDPEGGGDFPHHLGHGIGLNPHECPALNPHWDQVFEEGDVFTVEPGLYRPELKFGIRLEENVVMKADRPEQLSSFPLDL